MHMSVEGFPSMRYQTAAARTLNEGMNGQFSDACWAASGRSAFTGMTACGG